MKSIKFLSIAVMLITVSLSDAVLARAEAPGILCVADETPCQGSNVIHHTHGKTIGKAKLLSSITVECDALWLNELLLSTGLYDLTFTYTNCGSCEVEEENGPGEVNLLKEGHETASAAFEFLVHVTCSGFIDCSFNGTGLKGTVKGPLLSKEANGELSIIEQTLSKEAGGFLCPSKTKLDLLLTPLSATYITT